MPFLLDTHVLIWYVTKSPKLSQTAQAIVNSKSDLFISVASLWEITIKINIDKLQLDCSFTDLLERIAVLRADIIPIEINSLKAYVDLPFLAEHRDPFDRILVAQAMDRALAIVSRDEKFDLYPVQRIWENSKQ